MTIISISLNEKLLGELDSLKEDMGFSGRSDVIRAAARMLIDDNKQSKKISGNVNAVLFLIHSQKVEDKITMSKTQLRRHHKYSNPQSFKRGELPGNIHFRRRFVKNKRACPKL